jgi:hypothetical protein
MRRFLQDRQAASILMNDCNHQSSIFSRFVLVALLAAAVLAIGHYGLRGVAGPVAAGAGRAQMQFGAAGGRDAADVPPPPQSERAFAKTAQGGSERLIAAYTSPEAPPAVIAFYRKMLPLHGWASAGASASGTSADKSAGAEGSAKADADYAGTLLRYSNAAKDLCMITISEAPSGGSYVTIFRWPAVGVTK